MGLEKERLFAPEPLMDEAKHILQGGSHISSIAYVGPILDSGRMDAVLLADGLKGFARFVNRVAELHLGLASEGFSLEVEGEPQSGSLEIFVHFFHPLAEPIRQIADSKLLTGLAVVASLTGLSAKDIGKSLISTFKRRKGLPFKNAEDLEDIPKDLPISKTEYVRLFNDEEIRSYLRATFRPLRKDQIDQFETRANRQALEVVTKGDLLAADAAEMAAVITDEDRTLDIEKVSFFPHLAWHLSDQGKAFDAKIDDLEFWKTVEEGDRFGMGDKLHVHLHTEAERDANGKLSTSRIITKVHYIQRASGEQIKLF